MASNFGKTISFSAEQIATIPPESSRRLVAATKKLLAWQQFPVSIELGSDRPTGKRGDLDLRSFAAVHLGLYEFYLVNASLTGSPLFRGRPVINQTSFVLHPEKEVLEPEDILRLHRGFSGNARIDESLLRPQDVLRELGHSAMKLIDGVDALPYEFWNITESTPKAGI